MSRKKRRRLRNPLSRRDALRRVAGLATAMGFVSTLFASPLKVRNTGQKVRIFDLKQLPFLPKKCGILEQSTDVAPIFYRV
jgi:hypothetical protein